MFYASHPSIHVFVGKANTGVISTSRLWSEKVGAAKKLQSAVKAKTDLETNQISMQHYMKNIGRSFQAVAM